MWRWCARLSEQPKEPEFDALIAAFEAQNLSLAPYAAAIDITGETTLPLLEAEAIRDNAPQSSLGDTAWVSLQGVCGG